MIWGILIGALILFVLAIAINLGKDSQDLAGTTLKEKFSVIINMLNDAAFNGEGVIQEHDKKHIFLTHPESSNQMIEFLYSQGMLSVTWKYKYFQKELLHRNNLSNVRNLSLFEQQKIAKGIIEQMNYKIENHKRNVWSN